MGVAGVDVDVDGTAVVDEEEEEEEELIDEVVFVDVDADEGEGGTSGESEEEEEEDEEGSFEPIVSIEIPFVERSFLENLFDLSLLIKLVFPPASSPTTMTLTVFHCLDALAISLTNSNTDLLLNPMFAGTNLRGFDLTDSFSSLGSDAKLDGR